MNTPCPHCSAVIEIDPATHAALAGQSHFACPACNEEVPVPAVGRPRLQLDPAPGSKTGAMSSQHPQSITTASRKTNRNLLILGTTALLGLGGITLFLASRRSGGTRNTTQNIRHEIIYNSYFQNLIATGVTTMKDLEAIAEIRPYQDGFIGISKEPLAWESAKRLAERTGSGILALHQTGAPPDHLLVSWLLATFSERSISPLWIIHGGIPAVLTGSEVLFASNSAEDKRAVFRWRTDPSHTASPAWVDPTAPLPDADGWITLFDGGKLYSCSPEAVVEAGDKISISGDHLLLDNQWVTFDIEVRNLVLRVEVGKIDTYFNVGWREVSGKRKFKAYYTAVSSFGVSGIGTLIFNPAVRELSYVKTLISPTDFFVFEVRASDDQITIAAKESTVSELTNNGIDESGKISIGTQRGRSHVRSIQVKILDPAPSNER